MPFCPGGYGGYQGGYPGYGGPGVGGGYPGYGGLYHKMPPLCKIPIRTFISSRTNTTQTIIDTAS